MEKSYRKIAAVKKVMEIIRFMGETKEVVSCSEIAQAVNIPTGTVMCYLTSLEEGGFIQKVGEKFRLGMGIALVWARVKSNLEDDRQKIENDIRQLA